MIFFSITSVITVIILSFSSYLIAVVHSASGGKSNIYHKQDGSGGYAFGYDIQDPWGATNFRQESGAFDAWGGGSVIGSYGLADVDGRKRIVQYSADKNGFVAYIKTNEKGTSDEDAADAYYNGMDKNHGKWLYDFSIKHDKGWGDQWGKPDPWKPDPWDPWGKSDKESAKKKDNGWGASERHEISTVKARSANNNVEGKIDHYDINRVAKKGDHGQLFMDPKTKLIYRVIDNQHVIPLDKRIDQLK